jgi:tetratricopeptide (TPR) repeat protein
MNLRLPLAAAILLGLTTGCANNRPQSTPNTPPPALTEFEKSKDPPIEARTRFAAGQLAESEMHYGDAIAQYRKALKTDPHYADAMYRLGIVLAVVRDYPAAIETWTKYLALTHSATAYSNLGFCQELAGNPAAAEGSYRAGLKLEPTNEPCHINYGLMLARHDRPNEALLQLQTVLTPAKAHYDLAATYETLGRRKDAKAEYAKSLQIDPNLDDAKAKLASLGE